MIAERNILREIRLWCGQQNILCFRCNVGRIKLPNGGYFDTGLPEGFSDLIILPGNEKIIFCECKTKTGRLRDSQIGFRDVVTKRGYTYIVARSVEDVKNALF